MTTTSVRAPGVSRDRAVQAARPRLTMKRHRERAAWAMVAPLALGLIIFFVYPLIASLYYSFTRFDLVSPPQWIGLRNYRYLFTQDPNIGTATKNTLWFVVIWVPVRVLTALLVAGLLTRAKVASGFWRTLFYLPALVPPVASTVAFVFLFNPGTGPVNRVLSLIGIRGPLWFNDPAWAKPSLLLLGMWVMGDMMIIFLAALLDVPTEQYEAASVDGAPPLSKMRYITLPNIAPVLLFSVVTGIIAALQYFTEAAVASGVASGKAIVGEGIADGLGYPQMSLLTYTQWLYARGFGNYQLGYASAMAVVLFVVAGLFLVFLLRRVDAFTPEDAQ